MFLFLITFVFFTLARFTFVFLKMLCDCRFVQQIEWVSVYDTMDGNQKLYCNLCEHSDKRNMYGHEGVIVTAGVQNLL